MSNYAKLADSSKGLSTNVVNGYIRKLEQVKNTSMMALNGQTGKIDMNAYCDTLDALIRILGTEMSGYDALLLLNEVSPKEVVSVPSTRDALVKSLVGPDTGRISINEITRSSDF